MRVFRRFPREFWVLLGGDSVSHLGYGIFAPYVALYLTGPIGASNTATGLVLAAWGLVGLLTTPFGVLRLRLLSRVQRLGSAGPRAALGPLLLDDAPGDARLRRGRRRPGAARRGIR